MLPAAVGSLKNLEYFELLDSEVEELPIEFARLQKLQVLYVNNDEKFNLENNINILSQLPNLSELHLEGDNFHKVPSEIRQLQSLEYLFLNDNKLKELPSEIYQLKNLKYIDVSNNEIPNHLLHLYREDMAPTIRIRFK